MLAGASAQYEMRTAPTALSQELELNQVPAITWPYSFSFHFTLPKSAICKQGVGSSNLLTSTNIFTYQQDSAGVCPEYHLLLKQGAASSDR